jgi:hypothetical protein
MALGVRQHGADLHRAGVGAQQDVVMHLAALTQQVEGVVHRTRRMILRRVQRGEVVPVGFDLRAVGDVKSDGAKQLLDAIEAASPDAGCRAAGHGPAA